MDQHALKGKTIAAYIRVSSDQQDSTRQHETIDAWAKQHSLSVSHHFVDDEGRNPRDKADKRLHFQRLLRLVETGSVDAVIVDSQDRFGYANNAEFWSYIHQLQKNGCELWSVAQGNLSADDEGTIFRSTGGAVASTREQREKGYRSLTGKMKLARAGIYPGGYPPFGLDVVCYDADNSPRWRVVWVAHHHRIKIENDGTETEYKGKNNVPGRDKNDTLRYSPTIKQERLKAVQDIFNWYATENISPTQIASRLNKAEVAAVFGPRWDKMKIKELLRNPVYIGMPATNKKAGSRFWEYVNGSMQQVEKIAGIVKAGRRRSTDDFIFPDKPVFPPIVETKLFNKVQQKLQHSSREYKAKVPKTRSPRTASFWLRNIVVCNGCNRPMRAWNANPDGANPYRSYFCANYGTYGKDNPTGCHSNRVKAELLETIVERYLSETHETISTLLDAQNQQSLEFLQPMENEVADKYQAMVEMLRRMQGFVTQHEREVGIDEFEIEVRDNLTELYDDGTASLPETETVYSYVFSKRTPKLQNQLEKLDKEHSQLVDKVLSFPTTAKVAINKANTRILTLESRMQAINDELENVAERMNDVISELKNRKEAIEKARKSITGDAAYRRKSELVGSVINKVVCYFEDTGGKGNQPRSKLVYADIYPTEGNNTRFYPDGMERGRG